MPSIDENEDGTVTFTINSGELGGVGALLGAGVRELEKAIDRVSADDIRTTLAFLSSLGR